MKAARNRAAYPAECPVFEMTKKWIYLRPGDHVEGIGPAIHYHGGGWGRIAVRLPVANGEYFASDEPWIPGNEYLRPLTRAAREMLAVVKAGGR